MFGNGNDHRNIKRHEDAGSNGLSPLSRNGSDSVTP